MKDCHSYTEVLPIAEKLAREYFRFAIKESGPASDAYKAFIKEVHQIAFLAFTEARRTWSRKKGASLKSWTYFYLRQFLSRTFSNGAYHTVSTIEIRPEDKNRVLSLLGLKSLIHETTLILSPPHYLRLKSLLANNYQVTLAGRKIKLTPDGHCIFITARVKHYVTHVSTDVLEQCCYTDDASQDIDDKKPESNLPPDIRTKIGYLLLHLTPIQRKVIISLYGLFGCTPGTCRELANRLQLTEQRIRQIHNEALNQLRKLAAQNFHFHLLNEKNGKQRGNGKNPGRN